MLTAVLLALVSGCTTRHTPWPQTPQGMLEEKVRHSQNAYLRFAQAEEEARRDGSEVEADKYRQAKDAALQEYRNAEKELGRYEAEHPRQAGFRQ